MVNGKGNKVELVAIVPWEAGFVKAGFRQLHELLKHCQHFVLVAPAGRVDAPYGTYFRKRFKRIVVAHRRPPYMLLTLLRGWAAL